MEWVIIAIAGLLFGWFLGGELAGRDENEVPERERGGVDLDQ